MHPPLRPAPPSSPSSPPPAQRPGSPPLLALAGVEIGSGGPSRAGGRGDRLRRAESRWRVWRSASVVCARLTTSMPYRRKWRFREDQRARGRVPLQSEDVKLITVDDPFITTDYMAKFVLPVYALEVWIQSYSMLKCSHSAPLKRPRARFARLSAEIEAAGKAPAEPKPRVERICAMRASPIRTKTARVECPSERKKALTTPRSKAVRPRQELFHSVKHQKEPLAAAARKGTVVKSLFMSTTPKKELVQTPAADKSKGAVSEVCSKLRKLNLACREVPSKYMSQPQPKNTKTAKKSEETTVAKSEKRGLESKTNAKKKILGRSMKRANAGPDGENRNGCSTAVDENSLVETAGSHQERKVVLQELRIEVDASRCGNSDDNKENVSSAPSEEALDNSSHYGSENRLLENNDNVPLKENVALKVAKLQKKVHQEQAGKLKKTTNPRVLWDGWSLLKQLKPNTHSKNYYIHDIIRNFASGVMRTGASPIHLSIVSNGSYGLMESWARVLDFFANVGVVSGNVCEKDSVMDVPIFDKTPKSNAPTTDKRAVSELTPPINIEGQNTVKHDTPTSGAPQFDRTPLTELLNLPTYHVKNVLANYLSSFVQDN
ncbi:uncharacterized protein [Zea mays]|uniref:uncharacterized protein n=1 Tax=Zea mays TaxID=4577 RepID=UPI0016526DD5|nr:uncharacterized protein LOC118473514 [Zea mays]